MESSIYKYILRYSKRQQIILTLMAFGSFPFLYGFFELPKMIINDAIQAKSASVAVPYFDIEMD